MTTPSTFSNHHLTETVAGDVARRARSGTLWSMLIAGCALPLPYVREVLLGRIGPHVLGQFALLLLLINGTSAFFYPGGKNVAPALFPKLKTPDQRARFITGYLYLVLLAGILAFGLTLVWPPILNFIVQAEALDGRTLWLLRWVIPFVLLSSLSYSLLMAHMLFVWAALIRRIQLLCMTILAVCMFFNLTTIDASAALGWFAGTAIFASLMVVALSTALLQASRPWTWRPAFPSGFARFCIFSNLDAVMVYAYLAIDQFIIAYYFGIERLGVYFALLQISRLIPQCIQQLGHVLLTSFSRLLGEHAEASVVSGYRCITRLTTGIYTIATVVIIFFSRQFASLFGPEYATDHHYLLFLAVAMNIDSLRTVNAMTLMAYERMQAVFVAKLLQIVTQLALTLVLISSLGVLGVILAKGAGHLVSTSVAMFATSRIHADRRLRPPSTYWVGQFIVFAAAFAAFHWDGQAPGWSAGGVLAAWTALTVLGKYRWDDVQPLWPKMARQRVEA